MMILICNAGSGSSGRIRIGELAALGDTMLDFQLLSVNSTHNLNFKLRDFSCAFLYAKGSITNTYILYMYDCEN